MELTGSQMQIISCWLAFGYSNKGKDFLFKKGDCINRLAGYYNACFVCSGALFLAHLSKKEQIYLVLSSYRTATRQNVLL